MKKAKLDVVESDPPTSTGSSNSSTVDVVTNNPLKWDVTQVCDFVKNLAGCSEYVEDFQLQEIDGQALMLLKADHLMSAMSIKLGPALKICSAIEGMRDEISKNWRRAHKKRVLFKIGSTLVGEADVIEEQNNNNDIKDEEQDPSDTDFNIENNSLSKTNVNTSKNTNLKDSPSELHDDSVNNSSTSEDSGIFSSSNLGNESGLQTPSTSPPRLPIYAAEKKEDRELGDTSKKPRAFDFESNLSKTNVINNSCGRPLFISSSPRSSSDSDDSSMLDIQSRAAIYDEIFKLDEWQRLNQPALCHNSNLIY